MPKPLVAIIGRPNVGKSTLFNRLLGERKSIVARVPGVTRDRIYADMEWGEKYFSLVDTGGLLPGAKRGMEKLVREQAEIALTEAEVIVFLVDAKEGLVPGDWELAELVRKKGKKVLLVINKVDNMDKAPDTVDFFRLGLGEPLPISASHGLNVHSLLEKIVHILPPWKPISGEEPVKVAVVGKPNVGKSTLINTLLEEKRLIVTDTPGTTRDSVDIEFSWGKDKFIFIDTAGFRRRSRVKEAIEFYGLLRAEKSIKRADVVLLMIDSLEGITSDTIRIAKMTEEEGKAIIILANKWDLVKKRGMKRSEVELRQRRKIPFLHYAPLLFVSALTGEGVNEVLETIKTVYVHYTSRINTGFLNRALSLIKERVSLPRSPRGKSLKVYYATQAATAPPTIVLFVNAPSLVNENFSRYVKNSLYSIFGWVGTPVRIFFKGKKRKNGKL